MTSMTHEERRERRRAMATRVDQGARPGSVASEFGVSVQTVYNACAEFAPTEAKDKSEEREALEEIALDMARVNRRFSSKPLEAMEVHELVSIIQAGVATLRSQATHNNRQDQRLQLLERSIQEFIQAVHLGL